MTSCWTDDAEIPVVGPHAPALGNAGIVVGVERALAEVQIRPLPADVATARRQVLQRRVQQIAVGHEIPVAVGPRPRGGRRDPIDRVERRVGAGGARRLQILAEGHLDRRLPVARQIVGRADPRGDVLEAGSGCRRKRDRDRNELLRADLLFRIRARRVVEPDAALQRQPAERRLVLRIDRRRRRVVDDEKRVAGHRQLVRHAVAEPVLQPLVVGEAESPGVVERPPVADLHAVGAGDVGRRCPPAVGPAPRPRPVLRPVGQIRDDAGLLHHADQIAVVAVALEAAVANQHRAESGFEQQAVGHRRRPGDLLRALRAADRLGRRLGRGGRVAAADTRHAQVLFVPEQIELVPRRRLNRQTQADVLPRPVVARLAREVALVGPFGRVAGIQVVVHPLDQLAIALGAAADVVPQPVLADRTAERGIDVPDLLQLIRPEQAGGLQRLGVVAGLPGAGRVVAEEGALDAVAALARDDVHHRPAGLRFAQAAGGAEGDLLAVPDIHDVERRAAAANRRPDRQPIHLETSLAQAAAMNREGDHRRTGEPADILGA